MENTTHYCVDCGGDLFQSLITGTILLPCWHNPRIPNCSWQSESNIARDHRQFNYSSIWCLVNRRTIYASLFKPARIAVLVSTVMNIVAFTKLTFLSRLIGLVQGMSLKLKFARLQPPSLWPLVFRLVSPIKGATMALSRMLSE